MTTLRGIPAAPGMAVAPLAVLEFASTSISATPISLEAAVETAQRQLEALAGGLHQGGRHSEAEILETQAMVAADPELLGECRRRIQEGESPEGAILAAAGAFASALEGLEDELLAARAADVRDVAARIARAMRGEGPPQLAQRSVVVARDMSPSTTAELDPDLLAGIALEAGSPTAHAAILARALGIPAVVGIPDLLNSVNAAREVAIDGTGGVLMLDPGPDQRATVAAWEAERADRSASQRALSNKPLATADGHRIMLAANIGRPEEAAAALAAGAEGVGLLRTEFVFMGRRSAPDERTQTSAYAAVLRTFGTRQVVIRLLDVGGDKPLPFVRREPESNPFLGVRGSRLAAAHPELLATQLRAIVRAGEEAGIAEPLVMAPMIADLDDLWTIRGLLDEAVSATGNGVTPRLGIMVEVPSAVLLAEQLAPKVAFFSIGTNDLTQYLLAADRTNPALAARQDPLHPAVLTAIARVVDAARPHHVPVAVCGEMAGDPAGAIALVGLGVGELSMNANAFAGVKRALAALSWSDAVSIARRCLDAPDSATARRWIGELLPAS